ncbi:MAG TPA: hypothetical protein DCY13_13775 [Verrucomicrobiales bacterium]|nr:hypothetical protein [Verrucomicrobiales bacterium]
MSAAWNNLLDEAMQLGDVAAAGVFGCRRPPISRTESPDTSETDLALVWRNLDSTMDVSTHHRLPATQMRWIFELVLVYCIRRPDGMQLGLIVKRASPAGFDVDAAERLFEEFRNLKDT